MTFGSNVKNSKVCMLQFSRMFAFLSTTGTNPCQWYCPCHLEFGTTLWHCHVLVLNLKSLL